MAAKKKSASRKSPAKKAPARKSTARKTTARKSTARKSTKSLSCPMPSKAKTLSNGAKRCVEVKKNGQWKFHAAA